jgi:hypothetical protein
MNTSTKGTIFKRVAKLSCEFSFNISHKDQVTEAQCRMKIVQVWEEMTGASLIRSSSCGFRQNGPPRGRH